MEFFSPFLLFFLNEKGILAYEHQPFSQFFLASSWQRVGMLPLAPAFIQRLPRLWWALWSAKEGMGGEGPLGAGSTLEAVQWEVLGWDGGARSTHCAHCPARVNTHWHSCKGTAGLQLCPNKPSAVSQQALIYVLAILVLHPSKPNMVLQQFEHHGPAIPVSYRSKPSAVS